MSIFRLALLCGTSLFSLSTAVADQVTDQARDGAKDKATTVLPYTPSLDIAAMDRSANPCDDLYQFACGGWIKNNPIPADQASWSTYGKLYVDNQRYLWGILQQMAANNGPRTSSQTQLGNYFAACMNEAAIDQAGARPMQSELAAIDQLADRDAIAALLGELITTSDTQNYFMAIGSEQDAEDATRTIGAVYSGGLGLPDRDYYLEDSADRKSIMQAYREHVAAMFQLLGEDAPQASQSSATVVRIESALAKATLSLVERRDPYNTYHRMSLEELQNMAPGLDWAALFQRTGLKTEPWINVTQPLFVLEVQSTIERESLADVKTYLRWALVNTRAELISKPFRDQNFAFFSQRLRGIAEQRPRWRACVSLVDQQLGEALGKEFVERNFPPRVREDVKRMAVQIQQAMAERIDSLSWMSVATRQQAHDKLQKMRDKIGYPDLWRDYSAIEIKTDDFYGNFSRATRFDLQRQLSRIDQPLDRGEWFMTPATVNAYYNPSMNDINFPAGVLMPPLYDPKLDDAPNYGNTGGTIGHELVHGFDDEGRQYDGDGNLREWWTEEDASSFEERANCIRQQYGSYRVIDDIFINAELTSGEDIADLGGLILAWDAWQRETTEQDLQPADDLTPDQRFFVGFAQWACAAERPEALRLHAATDPHSPPAYRINGAVVNMPEFAKAFNCSVNAVLVKPEAEVCRIW
ncbi:MAG: M13 family metallopeptidase [Xanthomonadales bacterium]|nr:M13 family metallopeptidase [Xanthomonadales bacterium]